MTLSIHTVFVLRENILFLEEWIDYHIAIGFDKFFLYDNSNSIGEYDSTSETNKYGYNFKNLTSHISDSKLKKLFSAILKKFEKRVVHKVWSPLDGNNNVIYGQKKSILNYIDKYSKESDWTAFIDMDEFIYSRNSLKQLIEKCDAHKIGDIKLLQKKFDDRFNNLNMPVTQIVDCIEGIDTRFWAPKHIIKNVHFNIRQMTPWSIHQLPTKDNIFYAADLPDLRFNHYNVNKNQLAWMKLFYQTKFDFKLNEKCYDLLDNYSALKLGEKIKNKI